MVGTYIIFFQDCCVHISYNEIILIETFFTNERASVHSTMVHSCERDDIFVPAVRGNMYLPTLIIIATLLFVVRLRWRHQIEALLHFFLCYYFVDTVSAYIQTKTFTIQF